MWNNTRRGRNIIKQRKYNRRYDGIIKKVLICSVSLLALCMVIVTIVYLTNNVSIDIVAKKDNKSSEEVLRIDDKQEENIIEEKEEVKEENSKKDVDTVINYKEENENETLSFIALGEIMMGGNIHKSLSGSYTGAFKEISEYTKGSDYVVANFTTNITNLEKVENPKTKYIVTKKIINAFNALNIDALNIANDHVLDFGSKMFNTTKDILQDDEMNIIGLENEIIYAEANGIRVAFIGVCNEIIGMGYYYKKAGIFMYDMDKIKAKIKEANEKADTVVVMGHLGLENSYKITNIMSWYYKELIKSGADVVLGGHALGMYPIEIYNGKPIIYSLGYFIHDTNYELGKESGIFKFNVDIKGNITSIEVTPTYIKDKEVVVPYYEYSKTKAKALLERLSLNIDENKKEIKNNKLVINLK